MARGRINVEWLLTGAARSQLVFDMTAADEVAPMSGIVLADHELSTLLLREAITLVEGQLRGRPELFNRLGLDGVLLPV